MVENKILNPKYVFSKIGLALFLYIIVSNVSVIVFNIAIQVIYYILSLNDLSAAKIFYNNFVISPSFSIILSSIAQYFLAVPTFYFTVKKLPTYRYSGNKMNVLDLVGTFTVIISCGYLGSIISSLIDTFLQSTFNITLENPVENILEGTPLWLIFIIVVLIGPIVEEFIFRGLIIDRIRPYGELAAILFSGIIFGVFHGNFSQFFYSAAVGIVLAYIYIRTMKLVYPAILHMLFNFSLGFLPLLIEKISLNTFNSFYGELLQLYYGMFVLVFTVVGIVYFAVSRKKLFVVRNLYDIPKGKRFSTCVFNGGMITFAVVCLAEFVINLFL